MNMLLCRPEQLVRTESGLMQCLVSDARRIEHIRNILKLQEGTIARSGC